MKNKIEFKWHKKFGIAIIIFSVICILSSLPFFPQFIAVVLLIMGLFLMFGGVTQYKGSFTSACPYCKNSVPIPKSMNVNGKEYKCLKCKNTSVVQDGFLCANIYSVEQEDVQKDYYIRNN